MKEGYVSICYHCARYINPDEETIKTFIDMTPDRTAAQCSICNHWTLEGITCRKGWANLYNPDKKKETVQ